MTNENITYVKPGDTCCHGDFTIDFVSCDHGAGAPDAVGVVVTVDGKKIYEAGDTCLRLDRVDEYKAKGPFDVMIAPINGMYGNLNATDCAKLADALQPKLTVALLIIPTTFFYQTAILDQTRRGAEAYGVRPKLEDRKVTAAAERSMCGHRCLHARSPFHLNQVSVLLLYSKTQGISTVQKQGDCNE